MAAFLLVAISHHRRRYVRGLIDLKDKEDVVEVVDGVERLLGRSDSGR